ncbi:MAG: PhnD/SsuA/transferrin family substrate-binding protein [Chloroflexi bacterium]|nr:PhnD/SsuA/transferrin family substrate-binding protein [Chloroflexota bacterium]
MSSYTFMVCPHDTSNNPDKWLYFAQYLSLNSPIRVRLEMSFDFQDFHENFLQADMVYANPNDAMRFVGETGGRALAHPAGVYDEIVMVNPADQPSPLAGFDGAEVLSVEKMLVTGIGLRALAKQNIQPAGIKNVASWLAVVNELRQGNGRFGFIYKDTFEMLSETNRANLHPVYTSQEQTLFHSLVISPKLSDVAEALLQTLTHMTQSAEGHTVLQELGFSHWLPVTPNEWQVQQEMQG